MTKKLKQKNKLDIQYNKEEVHEIVKCLIPFCILIVILILFATFNVIYYFLNGKSTEQIFDSYYWMLLMGIIITMEQLFFEQLFYEAIQFQVRLKKAELRKFVSGMLLVAANIIMLVMHYGDFSNQEIFIKISHIFYFLGLIETGRWCLFYIQIDEKMRMKSQNRYCKDKKQSSSVRKDNNN